MVQQQTAEAGCTLHPPTRRYNTGSIFAVNAKRARAVGYELKGAHTKGSPRETQNMGAEGGGRGTNERT